MDSSVVLEQKRICAIHRAKYSPPGAGEKAGIALNVRAGEVPMNGMRVRPEGDTCGWYLWAGETLSDDDDFFAPLHIAHVGDWCPAIVAYLALPPGWRFLLAGEHADVWFDPDLVESFRDE